MTNLITRFDTTTRPANEDRDEIEVVRFFEKRKLIGEMPTEEILVGDDWEDRLTEFLAYLDTPKSVEDAIDFLSNEPEEQEDSADGEEERDSGSVVPEKYRLLYGSEQNCGDAIALALTAFVTEPRKTKKDTDGGLDRAKLRGVAEANGIGDKLASWEERGLNGGLLRMNTSNVLRGMNRRGEKVEIGSDVWPAREVEKKPRKRSSKKASA